MSVRSEIAAVTERIRRRSASQRAAYLARIGMQLAKPLRRSGLGCANLAHGFAACAADDKSRLRDGHSPDLGIVTAYNDMLSAHKPHETYPELIREAARAVGATAQVAGGTPAMFTQGEDGMDLSLFSRDVIALSVAVALSHQTYDAACFLGVCDKIVPGLFIGAMSFGHLPAVSLPAGPMTSGVPNAEKLRIRQLYAEGKVDRAALLDIESRSYHGRGTCTFYGTANSNQMLMEIMGVQLPGSSFINPDTPLRDVVTRAAVETVLQQAEGGNAPDPIGRVIDERSFVNALVGLNATGGSTNAIIHLVAMAAACGIAIDLKDFKDVAEVTPLLARVYPNGGADVNHFHAAGGMGFLIRQLVAAGLLHGDALTVLGTPLSGYAIEPGLAENGALVWREAARVSSDLAVLRPVEEPLSMQGGLKVLEGNFGRRVVKLSAVAPERHVIEAPARVFHSQEELQRAFRAGELDRDFGAVLPFHGPRAIGMPELHKLMPPLGALQDRGFEVDLVTDGRMSGASGKVPAAIHDSPETLSGSSIAHIRDGDVIRLDGRRGELAVLLDASTLHARPVANIDLDSAHVGVGRELFAAFRSVVGSADAGASIFGRLGA